MVGFNGTLVGVRFKVPVFSGASQPTVSDIPEGKSAFWVNGDGNVVLLFNVNGSITEVGSHGGSVGNLITIEDSVLLADGEYISLPEIIGSYLTVWANDGLSLGSCTWKAGGITDCKTQKGNIGWSNTAGKINISAWRITNNTGSSITINYSAKYSNL